MQQFPQFRVPTYHSNSRKSLAYHRNVIIVLVSVGFIFWSLCIAVPAGLCFDEYIPGTQFIGFMLVVVNSLHIICSFQTISLITRGSFPSHNGLISLRNLISVIASSTLIGFSIFISAAINFANYQKLHSFGVPTAFGCSFSFFWSSIVIICIIVYYKKCCKALEEAEIFQSNRGDVEVSGPPGCAFSMTSIGATQVQLPDEIQQYQLQQQQQQQQQNQLFQQQYSSIFNSMAARSEEAGPTSSVSPPSFVYVPGSKET